MKYAATYEYKNGRAVVQIGQLGKDRTEFRIAGEGVGDDMAQHSIKPWMLSSQPPALYS